MPPVRSMSAVHPWGWKYVKLKAPKMKPSQIRGFKKSFGLCMWLGESPLRGQGSTQLPVEAEWEPVESNFWYHTAVESHGPGYTCPCWCHDSTDDESQRWTQDVSIFCQLSSTFPYGALYFARLRVFSFHALSLFGVKTEIWENIPSVTELDWTLMLHADL